MNYEKFRERAGASVVLAIIGAIIGGIVGSGEGDAVPDAVIGGIAGALLSIIDVLLVSFWMLTLIGGGTAIIFLGLYAVYDSSNACMFILISTAVGALIGGIAGHDSSRGGSSRFRRSLQGMFIAFAITTCLVGVLYLIANSHSNTPPIPSKPPLSR